MNKFDELECEVESYNPLIFGNSNKKLIIHINELFLILAKHKY